MPISGVRFEDPGPDPEQRPVPGPPVKPAVPDKDERYEALQREADELRAANRQFMDLLGRKSQAPPPVDPKATRRQAAADDDDDIDWGPEDDADDQNAGSADEEDPAVLVDEISKHGLKALEKRGFVRASEVKNIVRQESRRAAVTAARQVVQRTRAEVTTESSIMREFPDLANPESDLFKATIPHVHAAAKLNPKAAKDPVTLYMAAKTAKAELELKSRGRSRGGHEDDEPQPRRGGRREIDDLDDRSERDIRIASQQGDRGRTRSRIESDGDEDFVMSDDARAVARAMGLTDDDYKKEATRIRGANTRSRR
jgi:hypothetical protein